MLKFSFTYIILLLRNLCSQLSDYQTNCYYPNLALILRNVAQPILFAFTSFVCTVTYPAPYNSQLHKLVFILMSLNASYTCLLDIYFVNMCYALFQSPLYTQLKKEKVSPVKETSPILNVHFPNIEILSILKIQQKSYKSYFCEDCSDSPGPIYSLLLTPHSFFLSLSLSHFFFFFNDT